MNLTNLSKYNKTITAVITGLIGWSTVVVTSSAVAITSGEWIMLATVLATSLGVYQIKNEG